VSFATKQEKRKREKGGENLPFYFSGTGDATNRSLADIDAKLPRRSAKWFSSKNSLLTRPGPPPYWISSPPRMAFSLCKSFSRPNLSFDVAWRNCSLLNAEDYLRNHVNFRGPTTLASCIAFLNFAASISRTSFREVSRLTPRGIAPAAICPMLSQRIARREALCEMLASQSWNRSCHTRQGSQRKTHRCSQ
jgi:hypothetical protein